jgi:lipid II:glycine glycyltransferase (peptidoglycan interpeptide bridge formation enzyme)
MQKLRDEYARLKHQYIQLALLNTFEQKQEITDKMQKIKRKLDRLQKRLQKEA